jgi:hypothetical protein
MLIISETPLSNETYSTSMMVAPSRWCYCTTARRTDRVPLASLYP